MAAKPLTTEAIALTEKKMDMTLDDIIKMSKNSKPKATNQRAANKSRKFLNVGSAQGTSKAWWFMESRSSIRQGVLAQRRSNLLGNQFPLATEVAQRAAAAPVPNRGRNHNRVTNWNKRRVGVPLIQRKAGDGGYSMKQPQQQAKVVLKQRPQTLDSLFANMKEQRLKVLSGKNNTQRFGGARQQQRRVGGGARQQQLRGRGPFGNFHN